MDVTSYLLGKQAGGGGGGTDLSEYFVTEITQNTDFNTAKPRIIVKKMPPINIADGVTRLYGLFIFNGNIQSVKLTGGKDVTDAVTCFRGCYGLESADLSEMTTENLQETAQMFNDCKNLQHIDMRNMSFANVTSSSNMFGASASNGVPDNCEIIVKDDTEKTWITTNFPRLTNVKTVAEYEASQS